MATKKRVCVLSLIALCLLVGSLWAQEQHEWVIVQVEQYQEACLSFEQASIKYCLVLADLTAAPRVFLKFVLTEKELKTLAASFRLPNFYHLKDYRFFSIDPGKFLAEAMAQEAALNRRVCF